MSALPFDEDLIVIRDLTEAVTRMRSPQVAEETRKLLTPKLTAYVAGVGETRSTREWAEEKRRPSPTSEERLRSALQSARLIEHFAGKEMTRTWFIGINLNLGGASPAKTLHESTKEEHRASVVAAAIEFVTRQV